MNPTYIPSAHAELINDLLKDGQEILGTMNPFKVNMLHAAVGISGEVDELQEIALHCIAKQNTSDLTVKSSPEIAAQGAEDMSRDHLIKELGDILFYEGALRLKCGALDLGLRDPDYRKIWKHRELPMEMLRDNTRHAIFANVMMSMNIAAGQILDLSKKISMYNQVWDPDTHGEQLCQYLVNLGWAISNVCALFRLSESEIRLANIAKLRERYPEGYSDKAAAERKDIIETSDVD